MENNIKGKVVVITGASSGFGEISARHLSNLGAIVVLGARRTGKIEKLAEEIRSKGGRALVVTTDVTDVNQVKKLVDSVVKEFGKIEALRQEVKPYNIRTAVISPGAVATDLPGSITAEDVSKGVHEYYEQNAISADSFARTLEFIISQPEDMDVKEILFRPTVQQL